MQELPRWQDTLRRERAAPVAQPLLDFPGQERHRRVGCRAARPAMDLEFEKHSMRIRTSRRLGFTLVEIMIVVAIIGLLAAIAIPNFVKARGTSQCNACIANLKQIDGAKTTWALETKAPDDLVPGNDDLYGPDKYLREEPHCPANGTYAIMPLDAKPICTVAGHTY